MQRRNLLDISEAKVDIKCELFSISDSFHAGLQRIFQTHFVLEKAEISKQTMFVTLSAELTKSKLDGKYRN